MATYTATYSAEDNKLRLYASGRLDAETFEKVKAAGFKWAPVQKLFVAPAWSPAREDLCLALAGDIEPEGVTMAERAAMKAERLDALAEKRRRDANAFARAAESYSQRFAGVLINPPFSEVKAHIRAALSVLAPGGVLVGLVPVTFDYPTAEELERLPSDTFAAARVNTKLIRIERDAPCAS